MSRCPVAASIFASALAGALVFGPLAAPWALLFIPWILLPPSGRKPIGQGRFGWLAAGATHGWLILAAAFWGGSITTAYALSGYTGWPVWIVLSAFAPLALFITAPWLILASIGPRSSLADAARLLVMFALVTFPPLGIFAIPTPLDAVLGIPGILLAPLPPGWPKLLAAAIAASLAMIAPRILIHRYLSPDPRSDARTRRPSRVRFAAFAGYSIMFMLPVLLASLFALVSHSPHRPRPSAAFSVTRLARGRPALGRPTHGRLLILALQTRQSLRAARALARSGALGALIQSETLSHHLQRLSRLHPGLITSHTFILTPEFSAGNLCHFPTAAQPLGPFLDRYPHTWILIGAEIPVHLSAGSTSGCTDGAALFRGPHLLELVSASQPAPISEWNPLQSGPDYPAHWFRSALVRLSRGGSLAVLVCYEGTVPWFPLLAASAAPRVLLSMDSDLWPHGRQAAAFEDRIVRAWGRFYGVSVAIADALPLETRRRERAVRAGRETQIFGPGAGVHNPRLRGEYFTTLPQSCPHSL